MNKISLALWWGAARGLAHIWVYKYLEEKNIEISEISWASMWAIVGAMIAIWMNSDEITKFGKELSILKLLDPEFRTGLLKWNKVEKKLEEIFWDKKIEDTKIPLRIVATNLETSESQVFDSWSIVEAVRASVSLPWIFIPKELDWVSYIDWGITMNLPIEVLSWKDVIAVSALKINTWKIVKTKTVLWMNFKSGFFKNNYETIKRSVIAMMKVNEDVSIKTPWKTVQLIRPQFWKLDIIDFNKVDEFVKIGYEECVSINLK